MASALERLATRLGLSARLAEERVLASWSRAVGCEVARHARAVGFRHGTLHVRVGSSAWAAQLALLEAEVLEKINQHLGENLVAGIRWEVRGGDPARATLRRQPGVFRVAGRKRRFC